MPFPSSAVSNPGAPCRREPAPCVNCCRPVQRVLNRGHPEPYWKTRGAELESCCGALSCTDLDGYAQAHTRQTKALYDVLARLLTASRCWASLHFGQVLLSPVTLRHLLAGGAVHWDLLGHVLLVWVVTLSCAVLRYVGMCSRSWKGAPCFPWRCPGDEQEEAPRMKRGGDLHPARPDCFWCMGVAPRRA